MIRNITAQGTETPKQTVALKEGINKIGRRSDDKQQLAADEVLIQTDDSSIHRQYHCVIEVIANGKTYDYILSPFESATNPTYLGQERDQMHQLDAIYLKENAVFQVGQDTIITLE
jgi:hypothetical protein